ncbi:Aldehyde Dehydrogenase [Beutenbergia cavernae DSM 12333]|uniref:L-glutamate gamma-semialdehyde dehydrogenase n=1 Tax=Beutenbergia cavernae (strain ATCC BAA-8 / DSM 12333 / CCUG 43141 / JCM 11478 / NBRC 16432 / NCIMB 13614 / HKI 0122) TaxID=471853 RepID=C5BYY0_BEUC1|nr:bifunctional proline dehydrogenase/L-glutamate gamma-semialdehyde dehydrogenase [Beutenbergia cavernae]ACQ81095.1 Aldehyde Dehydrogenase [Beutenbergia cavernae DSM 12333]
MADPAPSDAVAPAPDADAPAAVAPADLADEAVELAHRWAERTASGATRSEAATSARLAHLVANPAGLDLAVRFVDRVARPEDVRVAARELAQLSSSAAGAFLSAADRLLLGLGTRVAAVAPGVVVPLARRRLRQLVGHLVVDARDRPLSRHLAASTAAGFRLNINLLGEAVLGEAEAASRTERTRSLLMRDDVDYVSIKVSSLVSQISTWDTAGTVARVLERLRPLYRAAARRSPAAFVNLDMEEYRDLDLTVDVFTTLLAEPEFQGLEAGIVLQAYLPDSAPAFERLVAFARARRAAGGARIKVRLVKGANLAMERVEAELHGWEQAPYLTKEDVDANCVHLLDAGLRPEVADAVRLGVASHNLYDVALAHLLATRRGVSEALDVEMLQGMAPAQARAVKADVGSVLLYTPVVAPEHFDVAVSYLVRRLEENAAPENFLHALFAPHDDAGGAMPEQEARFRASVGAAPRISHDARRTAERAAHASGAAFRNAVDSDPALDDVRAWALGALGADPGAPSSPVLHTTADVDAVVERAGALGAAWGAVPAPERAAVLEAAADALERRRGDLVTSMAHEGGKTVAEADPEVSEAVDFARYYAASARALDATAAASAADGEPIRYVPVAVTLVTPPWNFPVAIPAGGVLAALAAGSAVVAKPAHAVPRCLEIAADAVREALTAHGHPADLVQVVRTDEGGVGRHLVGHGGVDQVILTGAIETARMFAGWRSAHPGGPRLFAETSGKNSLIVTPSADYDLAVADVVRSAFGHAGQKCSAASLLILVGSVGSSARFRAQLVDAVRSLRVGAPTDPGTGMGPVIEPPEGKLLRALTALEPGETWLVEPAELDADAPWTGRLWRPGVRDGVAPGSFFHLTECFGPVLGIMRASSLEQAIAWQNQVRFGLTGGIHSLDDGEIEQWLDAVEVGNAYVNRHITGAIVQRQPFGGWKDSAVGPGAKAGGPHYVAQLGRWEADPAEHGGPLADDAWLVAARASDAAVLADELAARDATGLRAEENLLRFRPVPGLTVRAPAGASGRDVRRVCEAAGAVRVPVVMSAADDAASRGASRAVRDVVVEDDAAFAARVAAGEVTGRVRVLGPAAPALHAAAAEADATILDGPVLLTGRRELLAVLREQAVSRTRHRFGHLEPGR